MILIFVYMYHLKVITKVQLQKDKKKSTVVYILIGTVSTLICLCFTVLNMIFICKGSAGWVKTMDTAGSDGHFTLSCSSFLTTASHICFLLRVSSDLTYHISTIPFPVTTNLINT